MESIWSERQDKFGSLHGLELPINILSSCLGYVYHYDGGNLNLYYLTELVHVSYFFPKSNYVAYKGVAYKP